MAGKQVEKKQENEQIKSRKSGLKLNISNQSKKDIIFDGFVLICIVLIVAVLLQNAKII